MKKQFLMVVVFIAAPMSGVLADMSEDSPVEFPKQGALPAKHPPDRPPKEHEKAEEGYAIFSTPERSLEQIAKIQAEMPKGEFTPPKPDWSCLAHTRRTLTEGGGLRLLAMGDSIVNDTMRSGWVAKLQQAYPKADIRATVYVRGGGGCQHYKEEGRIAKYVVPRKPDLVLIGGISQKDIESIREVIRQLRAALPQVEVLLTTGVFGAADPRVPEELAKAPHSGTGPYGAALQKLAAEERCAYLDMTTPWAEYIRSSKVHPHRFYRDVVHANEFGEQILAKILIAFLAPEGLSQFSLGENRTVPLRTDVYVSGKDGYFAYRIPVIESAPDGSLLALAEARKYNLADPGMENNDIDLVCKRSTDAGRTWSAMKVIEDPGEKWSAANAATVVDRQTRRVWLHYLRCQPGRHTDAARPGTDDVQNLVRFSDDNGVTWSEPTDLSGVARDMKDTQWRCSVPGPGGAIQDCKGRLIVPIWKVAPWGVTAIYSDDHGTTWKRGAAVPGNRGGDENQLVELADGRILMDYRQQSGPHRWLAASSDGGQSWAEPRPGVTVTPVCCAIERLTLKSAGSGRDRILWTGPKGPGRNKLVARVSYDEGQTFQDERPISDEPAAYTDLTVLADKSVGILWERGDYKFITFTRIDLSWLEPK